MANRINNAVINISKKDLVTCKRCGCPDLAWVRFASGKSGLVQTAGTRPFWRGEGPAPVGLFALKFNYHRCDEYLAAMQEAKLRASQCHPKANNPKEIITDAMKPIMADCAKDNYKQLTAGDGPLFDAMEILLKAMGEAPSGR